MNTIQTDVAIIGAGSAGLPAYRAAKAAGASAILIEGGPHGTTCARVGCMPSKLLIAAAEAAYAARHTAPFGVHVDGVIRIDGREVMQRVKSERDRLVGFVLDSVEAIPASDKLTGYARFIDDGLLQVGDHTRVRARSVVIATGSSPVMPAMYRALGERAIINDDVFEWSDLPRKIAVVGAGVIGLELGQALAHLGVNVTVIGARGRVGPLTDPAIKAYAARTFQDSFRFEAEAEVEAVSRVGNEVQIRFRTGGEQAEDTFDYVLVTAGRKPNFDRLALHNTSLTLDHQGMPVYDPRTLQVGTQPVFIAGDANGVLPLLHEAADEGRVAGTNAARFPDSTCTSTRLAGSLSARNGSARTPSTSPTCSPGHCK
jgi:dihydrolipoamide dehydrogenase